MTLQPEFVSKTDNVRSYPHWGGNVISERKGFFASMVPVSPARKSREFFRSLRSRRRSEADVFKVVFITPNANGHEPAVCPDFRRRAVCGSGSNASRPSGMLPTKVHTYSLTQAGRREFAARLTPWNRRCSNQRWPVLLGLPWQFRLSAHGQSDRELFESRWSGEDTVRKIDSKSFAPVLILGMSFFEIASHAMLSCVRAH